MNPAGERLEQSAAVERLERLERAAVLSIVAVAARLADGRSESSFKIPSRRVLFVTELRVQLNTSKDSGEDFGTTGTALSAGTTGTIGTVSSERSDCELLRQLALVVVAVLLCIAFSGLPALAQQTTKVRMAYSAFSISFLNIFLARDAGLFKKHGIDVELIQMAGPLPIAALSAGEIDYLTGYTTGLVATGQGIPLKGIMVALRRPPFYVVAEPNIKTLSDLGGKRVGVDRIGSLQHLVTRLLFKNKAVDPEKVIFTQTGSVSNTVTSLGQGAVSAALLSGPHNVIMTQKGFRQVAAADELPMSFPTSGLVVHEAKLKADANRIKAVIRAMLDSVAFSHKERAWVVNYVRDKWKLEPKIAETVYEQWLSTLTPDGKINLKDLQDYFDLAYAAKQIPAPIQVAGVTDYTLLDQVLRER